MVHSTNMISSLKIQEYRAPMVFGDSCLVQICINCCGLECVAKIFDEMPERNFMFWSMMMLGYSVNGKTGLVQSFFDLMPQINLISWKYLLSGYLKNGRLRYLCLWGRDAVACSEATFFSGFQSMCEFERLFIGQLVHGAVLEKGFEVEVVTPTAMLDMYAKCNMLDESFQFLHPLPVKVGYEGVRCLPLVF